MRIGLSEGLERLMRSGAERYLLDSLRGLEKEGLRVKPSGQLSDQPHPQALGAALTHDFITTDYSEAQLELITPACRRLEETLNYLEQLHRYVYGRLGDELIWVNSMPCLLEGEDSIPIATYGSSLIGQLKHVYRKGLAYRYGKAMQTISGVHFNYSFTQDFWQAWGESGGHEARSRDFVDAQYFGIIRNFLRVNWWLVLIFGASPAVCNSFFQGRPHQLSVAESHTAYGPYATSLRMSDLGYQNAHQQSLVIEHNDVFGYARSLQAAMKRSEARYEKIGVKVQGEYRQLSTGILQIENEYYGSIRPKRTTHGPVRPSDALINEGVEYLEVRCLDLDPFEPVGVSLEQLQITELVLLHALLTPSPAMSHQEFKQLRGNLENVVLNGANPKTPVFYQGKSAPIAQQASLFFKELDGLAQAIGVSQWSSIRESVLAKLEDFGQLPAARILTELSTEQCSFFEWAIDRAEQAADFFKAKHTDAALEGQFEAARVESLKAQIALESDDSVSFDTYLARFLGEAAPAVR